MNQTIREFAAAKVNLYLHVTGRRPDGYHLLESLMVFVDIGDSLTFAPHHQLSLTIDGPEAGDLASEPENIILKAARALAQRTGHPPAAAIHLRKMLPVASGIGGGSADAAAALRGLCRLWSVTLPDEDLQALALTLGADVPVCLKSRPMLVSGIGEHMIPAPSLPPYALVLANPRRPLSTPSVFKARQGDFTAAHPLTGAVPTVADFAAQLIQRHNGLTMAAQSLEPSIAPLLDSMAALPDCLLARMSGSGATCFALFATIEQAQNAAETLAARHPNMWIAAAEASCHQDSLPEKSS